MSGVWNIPEMDACARAQKCPNSLYEDPDFPADATSLFVNPSKPSHSPSLVHAWLRPKEIVKNPTLFVGDRSTVSDVCQGSLGDCWFLGALAGVSERWDLLQHLVVSTHPELGFYQFRFWKEGRWVEVTVDDRIPCKANQQPIYAHSKNPNVMWVSLLEKAYAKLHGSYEALDGGSESYALVDLTGGCEERLDFDQLKATNKVWERLLWNIEESWPMGASFAGSGTEKDDGMGILSGHAYSVLGAVEAEGEKLVQLRNPWGEKEWNGPWSDSDKRWTPALLKKLNHKKDDDGIFFMTLKDFEKHFNRLYCCRLYHDEVGIVWRRHQFLEEWQGHNAGGCLNNSTWTLSPQYSITPEVDTQLFISLCQGDMRFSGRPATAIGMVLMLTDDDTKRKTTASNKDIVVSTDFTDAREVVLSCEIKKGMKYICVPSTFDPRVEVPYSFTTYTKDMAKVNVLRQDGTYYEDDEDPFITAHEGSGLSADDFQGLKKVEDVASKPTNTEARSGNKKVKEEKEREKGSKNERRRSRRNSHSKRSSQEGRPSSRRNSSSNSPHHHSSSRHRTNSGAGGSPNPGNSHRSRRSSHPRRNSSASSIGVTDPAKIFDDVDPATIEELTYEGGDSYRGQVTKGKKDGRGIYTYSNGDVYTGEFSKGLFHGSGSLVFHDGSKYVGKFGNGDMEDTNAYHRSADGAEYIGGFIGGKRNGYGKLMKSTFTYEGYFKDSLMDGDGKYTYDNGDSYTGEFKNGKFNGKGKYSFADGSTPIEGTFKDGKPV